MRFLFFIILALTLLVIIGCSNTIEENQGQDNDQDFKKTDPIHNETKEERDRLGTDNNPAKKYLQSSEKGIGRGGEENNIFKTDEAREVVQQLSLREDVKQTQVATTDEQVAVFVLLHDYQDPNIANSLEKEIEKIVPNKDVFVYTDKVHWNRLKDLDSSMKARQIGNDLEKFLEDNFNIEIKD